MGDLAIIRGAAMSVSFAAMAAAPLSLHRLATAHAPSALGATFTPTHGAIVVDSLRADGPARRAGLRVGDTVRAVDGIAPASTGELDRIAARHDPVDIRVRRGDSDLDIIITAGHGHGGTHPADRGR